MSIYLPTKTRQLQRLIDTKRPRVVLGAAQFLRFREEKKPAIVMEKLFEWVAAYDEAENTLYLAIQRDNSK